MGVRKGVKGRSLFRCQVVLQCSNISSALRARRTPKGTIKPLPAKVMRGYNVNVASSSFKRWNYLFSGDDNREGRESNREGGAG